MRKKILICFVFIFLLFLIFLGAQKISAFQGNPFAALVSGFFPFWQKNQPSIPDENANPGVNQDVSAELVEKIDDFEEQIDILNQKIAELEKEIEGLKNKTSTGDAEEIIDEKELEEGSNEEDMEEGEDEAAEEVGQEVGQKICEKTPGAQPLGNKIIINEIAWMGTNVSASNEWIEIKNISGTTINLDNWQLLDKDQQIKIIFNKRDVIPLNGFFLLERTNDDSVLGVTADLIYTGTLSNTNEALYLFDEKCQLQDEVLTNPNWLAGDNSSKRTMERKSNLTWQTSYEPGGTPKRENGGGYFIIPPAGSGGGGAPLPAPPPPVVYPKILITEVRISPLTERFVELYNPNNETVNLTGWYIQRKVGDGSSSSFISSPNFEGKTIGPFDYFLITHSSSTAATDADILLNLTLTPNNTLLLKNPKEEITNEINWGDILEGFSYGRIWDDSTDAYLDNFEVQEPTPKEKNKPKQNQPPTASFTFSPQNPLVGDEILFDASSSTDPDGQIASFLWDFGDDNSITINQATTTHSYATSTDFTIGLQVIDNEGAVSALATSTIFVAETGAPFSELDVVINEIAWMGTTFSAGDEWLEIYNNTDISINLDGWILKAIDGTPTILLFGVIPVHGYYLLERADDDAVPDIPADLIYGNDGSSWALKNTGEELELYDKNGNLIDKVGCIKNEIGECKEWFGGNNTTKQTMERINPADLGNKAANWSNSQNPGGTPKSQNSQYIP